MLMDIFISCITFIVTEWAFFEHCQYWFHEYFLYRSLYVYIYQQIFGVLSSAVMSHALFTANKKEAPTIPVAIERIVRKQNLLHNKNRFCPEHFQFMKKLINCNIPAVIDYIQQHQSYSDMVSYTVCSYSIYLIQCVHTIYYIYLIQCVHTIYYIYLIQCVHTIYYIYL